MTGRGNLIGAVLLLVGGVWLLFFQHHFQAWNRRRHQEALADRHARGRDAYFEELRALEAYPPETVSPPMQRVLGALMIFLAGSYLAALIPR